MNEAHHLLYIPTFSPFLLQLVAPTELEPRTKSNLISSHLFLSPFHFPFSSLLLLTTFTNLVNHLSLF